MHHARIWRLALRRAVLSLPLAVVHRLTWGIRHGEVVRVAEHGLEAGGVERAAKMAQLLRLFSSRGGGWCAQLREWLIDNVL